MRIRFPVEMCICCARNNGEIPDKEWNDIISVHVCSDCVRVPKLPKKLKKFVYTGPIKNFTNLPKNLSEVAQEGENDEKRVQSLPKYDTGYPKRTEYGLQYKEKTDCKIPYATKEWYRSFCSENAYIDDEIDLTDEEDENSLEYDTEYKSQININASVKFFTRLRAFQLMKIHITSTYFSTIKTTSKLLFYNHTLTKKDFDLGNKRAVIVIL